MDRQLLNTHAAGWFEAVNTRHSRRTFDGITVGRAELDELEAVCQGFRPFEDARIVLVREPGVDVFRGVVGSYGKVVQAPHVLVMIAGQGKAAQWHLGYTGEAALLEATRLGLGTCWIGGFFDREKVAGLLELAAGERVFAVSPVGYPTSQLNLSEQLMRGMARAHKRRPVDQIAENLDDSWPSWARAAVECARLAPSAVNRQPWRFRMSAGALVIRQDNAVETPSVTKALDCGIAMLHAELGAHAAGAAGNWHTMEEGGRDLARFETEESL